MRCFEKARELLIQFKGENYLYGRGVLREAASKTNGLGKRVALIRSAFPGSNDYVKIIEESLSSAGFEILGEIAGAAPNTPSRDVGRITAELSALKPEVVLSFGGGSTIDAAKAAAVLYTLGGTIEDYFGTGQVCQSLAQNGKSLIPHVAIQAAASSAAHLTKYSNITDLNTGQKKLIVDPAIVPIRSVFDYLVSYSAPPALTADGAMDGFSHCLEVLYSAVEKPEYTQVLPVALEGIRLIVEYLPHVLEDPMEASGRQALGLATDLGGYAIMLGGTNGAHLTSFSLVDILSHGRACAMLNPYYTVFFAPAIQHPLRKVGAIFRDAGYARSDIESLKGRELGVAVAKAIITFEKSVGLPTSLGQVPGFTDAHIERALTAAKNPQLKMKLENMPVPLRAEMIDEAMAPVLFAARDGNLDLIP